MSTPLTRPSTAVAHRGAAAGRSGADPVAPPSSELRFFDLSVEGFRELREIGRHWPLPHLVVLDGTALDDIGPGLLAAAVRLRRQLLASGGDLLLVGPSLVTAVGRHGLQWSLRAVPKVPASGPLASQAPPPMPAG